MARQTWTALVAALCFGVCILVAALVPVPFVVWAPGTATDVLSAEGASGVTVSGATNYPTTGRLLLTTTSQTRVRQKVTILEALYAYWASDREVLPESAIYPAGVDADAVDLAEAAQLASSEQNATAAALRSAGIKVDPVPVVESVNAAGPSANKLFVQDIVTAVRFTNSPSASTVQTAAEASAAIASGKVGAQLIFSVIRDGLPVEVIVTTQASKSNAEQPVAGVSFTQGYRYAPVVTFGLGPELGGDGAGLILALATYDKVTPDALLKERVVAGTGSVDANGVVGRVGAVREKVVTAERAGASVFLLPQANCAELADVSSTLRLVPVATLADAVAALGALADPAREKSVKGCS